MPPPRPLTIGLALTLAAGALLWAPPAVSSQPISEKERPARPRFVPDELLVRFRPGTPAAERASVRSRQGLSRIRSLPLPGLELVRVQGNIPAAASRIGRDPAVRFAEPNFLWYPDQIPDDPGFDELWGLHNTGQTGGTPDADIDAPEAWELAADTSGIVVAVIDTGVWIDHPDLQDAIWTNPGESGGGKETNGVDDDGNGFIDDVHGWDFFNNDATVFDATQPDDHGTHVAGTIAATFDNATDVTGVSRARIMPLKFLGPQGGTTAAAIQAVDYAIDNGAHLTNNSWGGGAFSSALQAKIEDANVAGQLFVAAAGNGGDDGVGDDNDVTPHFPASYPNQNIISVAATTHADGLASFSNFGAASVDLGAPGDRILSTVPRFAKAVLVGPDTGAPVSSRSAYHTFGLEGISSSAHRKAILSAALAWMEVSTADPVLVVADDGPASFQAAYTDALGVLGFTDVDTSIVPTGNHGPTAGTMSGYEAVIWFTGNQFSSTLTLNDQAALGTYLAGGAGRNLLLFGQDIGYDLTTDGTIVNTFVRDTLRADYVADYDANFRPSGIPGTPYAAVPTIQLSQSTGSGGQFFSSALEPRTGAVAGMRGGPTTWFNGTSMATPHVTGAAALVLATHPSLGHLDVKARLLDRGDAVPALIGKTVSGRRLNAAASLETDPPGAPMGLTATAAAGGEIDLSWSHSSGPGVAGYNVYRDTTSGFSPSPANRIASLVSGTEYLDESSNTVDGTTYHYIVRAENSQGMESADSNEASATADATPPQVDSTVPPDDATEVTVETTVTATFDEAIDPSTLGPSTFTLTGPGGAVTGDVSYDPTRTAAIFTPHSSLAYASIHTAEVTSDVQDVAGNPLPVPVAWTFETTAVDTTAPQAEIDEPGSDEQVSARPHAAMGTATDDDEMSGVDVAVRRDDDLTYWNGVGFVPEETWNEATIIPGIGGAVTWSLEWMPPVADGEPFTVLVRGTDASDNVTDPPAERPFSVDNTAPTGSVSIQAGAAFTADTAVTLTLSATDGTGVADVAIANETEPSGPYQPFTGALAWDLEAGPDGPRSVHVRFRDEAGNESTAVVDDIILDTTPPTALPDPLGAFQRDRRFDVAWTGSDGTSGIDEFRVEVREAALKGGWNPWTEWVTTPETSASFLGRPGRTYCFRVSAADLAGNASEPDTACTAVPANDRGLKRKGSWRDRSAGRSYLGTFTVSKQRGDRLIVGRVRAREITLVHTRCRRCGKVEVLFRGKVIRRLGLRAPTTKRQAIRRIVVFDGVRSGKLLIVVRSNGRKVPIEGVGVSRV